MDDAVQNGMVQPGQYLILRFDFSRVTRNCNVNEPTNSLEGEINRGLSKFKLDYSAHLGDSFASAISHFPPKEPAGNLADLIIAVDHTLRGIQERGDKNHPLRDVRGVCLFYTTAYHDIF